MPSAASPRPPTATELAASRRYVGAEEPGNPAARLSSQPAWSDFAQSLFNLKEFIFLR